MSKIICSECSNKWDLEKYPICPHCLYVSWKKVPGFIRDKHDPTRIPYQLKSFRSVISHEFISNLNEFKKYISFNGTCLYNNRYQTFNFYLAENLGIVPGSAIPPNHTYSTSGLEGIMIADAIGSAHAFCVNKKDIQNDLDNGILIFIPRCSFNKCSNFCLPGSKKCKIHSTSNN